MKKSALLLFILCLIGTSSFAQAEKWSLFKEDGFEILFPDKPKFNSQTTNSAIGPLVINMYMHEASAKDENLVYSVMTTVYPDSLVSSDNKEQLPTFFRGAIDGGVKNAKGKLLSESEIETQGFPGRKIKISFNGDANIISIYAYLVKNKLYMLQVVGTAKKENNQSARQFFESFKLSK
jgi:hypothetical protein